MKDLRDIPVRDFLQATFEQLLEEKGFKSKEIEEVLDSGYYLKNWMTIDPKRINTTVSDMMYGNKAFSSSFEIDDFLNYVRGEHEFEPLPAFKEYTVKNIDEIQVLLSEFPRSYYIEQGQLSFRGQTSEYKFQRKIPNPVRRDSDGKEVSILPGLYRQNGEFYSFKSAFEEKRSFDWFLRKLEPNPQAGSDTHYAYDFMRVEQHYATQTPGLDLSFDIEMAVFFATHKFYWLDDGLASYKKISKGENTGVIYCFRFLDPLVKRTDFQIKGFDFFKTYPPERILRQSCALPLFLENERNIAITDIDCVIKLDSDFEFNEAKSREYMFPSIFEDGFYQKILELKDQFKDRFPEVFSKIVEYEWARQR